MEPQMPYMDRVSTDDLVQNFTVNPDFLFPPSPRGADLAAAEEQAKVIRRNTSDEIFRDFITGNGISVSFSEI